ncbi:MAG: RdgB/HAM1 family non-canonical purine NTP pyrophosphatase [Oscillospiraceae bacterium]|nr:RdgB/HAM1 family non-canonical purine NTP pyrophosphatase [Oscillospiraceae bacterium]
MKIVMATNNENKLREAREILAPLGIEVMSQQEAGIATNPEENGETFAENAMIKAAAVYELAQCPVIADDSGLCVDALNGAPGVYSARYAPKGEECATLLSEMKHVPDEQRGAHFQCAIAYIDASGYGTVSASCAGKIGYEARGENGFGYDPVFLYNGTTLAEMTSEQKNAISHRGAALRLLFEVFRERYGDTHADQ